jgi:hypothetical protein
MRSGGWFFYKEARKAGDFLKKKTKNHCRPKTVGALSRIFFMVSWIHYKAGFFIRRPGK